MSRIVSDFQGEAIYLDTMVFHLLIRAKEPEVRDFFQRIEQGELQAYTSILTFDELVYRLLLGFIRDNHTGSPLDHMRRNQKAMILQFYPRVQPHLAKLQTFPNLHWLDVVEGDLSSMDENIRSHQLLPRDALHLAAMQKIGCMDIVSHDSDFDHIAEVQRYTLT